MRLRSILMHRALLYAVQLLLVSALAGCADSAPQQDASPQLELGSTAAAGCRIERLREAEEVMRLLDENSYHSFRYQGGFLTYRATFRILPREGTDHERLPEPIVACGDNVVASMPKLEGDHRQQRPDEPFGYLLVPDWPHAGSKLYFSCNTEDKGRGFTPRIPSDNAMSLLVKDGVSADKPHRDNLAGMKLHTVSTPVVLKPGQEAVLVDSLYTYYRHHSEPGEAPPSDWQARITVRVRCLDEEAIASGKFWPDEVEGQRE